MVHPLSQPGAPAVFWFCFNGSYTEVKSQAEYLAAVLGRGCGCGYCFSMRLCIVPQRAFPSGVGSCASGDALPFDPAMSLSISQSPTPKPGRLPQSTATNSLQKQHLLDSKRLGGRSPRGPPSLPPWPITLLSDHYLHLILLQLDSTKNWHP